MIAEVVIANNSRELDKKFSYIVPDGVEVSVGARVVVPFGRGNKTVEAIVTGFADKTSFTRLKEISKVIDRTPLCTPALLELAEHIHRTSVCTLFQALRLVVASGTKVKTTRFITLLDNDIDISKTSGRSASKKRLLETLIDGGGTVDYATVADIPNVSAAISSLEKLGIISLDEDVAQSVKSRLVRMVRETDFCGCTDMAEMARKAPKQFKMLEILRQTGDVSAADLVAFSQGTYNALKALWEKGLVEFYDQRVFRTTIDEGKYQRSQPPELTEEQKYVLERLVKNHRENDKKPNLIRGVTGSGKTEVFLQIIDYFLKQGREAIVLVPEISLTPQMVSRFASRFGKQISVLHSGLSQGERFDEWNKILRGDVKVAIGARSAIFAPFKNLGIIIIDEEHETTYKSDTSPRYDAREAAMFRGKNEGAMVVMASATPSVNSFYKAKCGEYNLYEMKTRHNLMSMPKIDIVDMRTELKEGNHSVFSKRLKAEIDENIKRGKQTILFLNRRGFNSFVMCRTCGEAITCRNCSVAMTYHKNSASLKCHYCGYAEGVPRACPECGSNHIRFMGTGTEKIEEEIVNLYGERSFVRMDGDTTSGKNSHEAILNRFRQEKIPILLGTQMVTKGLDFPDVTLVGVLAADMALNVDDFRAAERTFCQITQVCGRAGRGDTEGRAIVQTYQPEHYAVELARNHDYEGFYQSEINIRKQLKNPPFTDIVMLMMQGDSEPGVMQELGRIANRLKARGLNVMGPVPSPYTKIKNKYRWRIILKHKNAEELLELLHTIADYYAKSENQLFIDINPNSMN